MQCGQIAKEWSVLQNAELCFHFEGAKGGGECGAVHPLLQNVTPADINDRKVVCMNKRECSSKTFKRHSINIIFLLMHNKLY
jgi:hypothetical protein